MVYSDDRKKLRTLLGYWITHNNEHGMEFSEWAEKAKSFAAPEVTDNLLEAVAKMGETSVLLTQALQKLKDMEE